MDYFKQIIIIVLSLFITQNSNAIDKILNVSYDPTVKLYKEINESFENYYQKTYNRKIKILQSHGGSAKQARAVIEGIPADVVSLATEYDINEIAKKGLIKSNWQKKFKYNSSAFSSIIVFLVRKNNPKFIFDWSDLIRENISVIMPNPKTSGVAKLEYMAAWLYAIDKYKDETKCYNFLKKLFGNIPILDSGSRSSAMSFTNRNLGDVLITWENEAHLIIKEIGNKDFDIIIPNQTLEIGLPLAIVKKVVQRRNSKEFAKEYLKFLYKEEAQFIAAKNFFRPNDPKIYAKYISIFPKVKNFDSSKLGDIKEFYRKHFNKNGFLEKIFEENRK